MKFALPALLLLMITGELFSQNIQYRRENIFSAGYIQVKEESNFGLVFKGPSFDFGMHWELPSGSRLLVFEYRLGPGLMFAKDIIGLNFSVRPADLGYLWKIPAGKINFYAGPAFRMQYDVQFYPNLQSGYDYWLTSYSAGGSIVAGIPLKNGELRINLYSSLMALTSRTEPYTDPYFFDLGFKEVMKDAHSNFKFSGFERFANTSLSIKYRSNKHQRLAISYVLDYFSYSNGPDFKLLNQSLRISVYAR